MTERPLVGEALLAARCSVPGAVTWTFNARSDGLVRAPDQCAIDAGGVVGRHVGERVVACRQGDAVDQPGARRRRL